MPSGKSISEETKRRIIDMALKGYSMPRIAVSFGLHKDTIWKVLHEQGVSLKCGRKSSYIYGE